MDPRFSSSYFGRSDASTDEVVEDSEPERVERRRIRRASKQRSKPNHGRALPGFEVRSVIEQSGVSGDPALATDTPAQQRPPPIVINPIAPSSPDEPPSIPEGLSQSGEPSVAEMAPFQAKPLDLARFAYTGRAGSSKPPSTRSPSRCSSVEELLPPKTRPTTRKPKAAASSMSIASDDPELDLTLVLRCPSCRVSWTTRKSSSAKAHHIRTCATKNGMTVEAAKEAIRQDIAKTPSRPPSKGKAKGKAKVTAPIAVLVDDAPKTYLDKVVEGAAPKKRQPRRNLDTTVTVKPPVATHGSILERAKAILAETQPSPNSQPTRSVSSAESDVILLDDEAPPPTQPFLTSKLGSAFRRPPSPSEPENQQPRGKGHAGSVLEFFEGSDGGSISGKASFKPPPPRDTPEPFPNLSSLSLYTPSPPKSRSVRRKRSPSIITIASDGGSIASLHPPVPSSSRNLSENRHLEEDRNAFQHKHEAFSDGSEGGWSENGSGCLVWDGKPDATQPDLQLLRQWESESEAELRMSVSSPRSSTSKRRASATPKKRATKRKSTGKTPKKSKTKKPRSKTAEQSPTKQKEKINDGSAFEIFKNMIEQDEELHCKILRYEPVNIKVFIQKAETLGLQSPKLLKQMKTFLDIACIIYFDTT